MPRSLNDPGLDANEQKALRDVEEHGLHVLHVLPEGDTPGWAYSIGLWRNYNHPEVAVFGLSQEVAHHLLNLAAEEIRAGRPFTSGADYDDLLEGVRCAFRAVAPMWHRPFFGWAEWFYEGEDYSILQCVWPDHEHHWPWEEGFRPDWVWAQPLLWHTAPIAARAAELLDSMGLEHNPDDPE